MAGTRTFEVDFDNNLVKQLDVKYKIEKIPRRHAKISCHVFKVKEDMKKISSSVQLTPGKKSKTSMAVWTSHKSRNEDNYLSVFSLHV